MSASQGATVTRTDAESGPIALGSLCLVVPAAEGRVRSGAPMKLRYHMREPCQSDACHREPVSPGVRTSGVIEAGVSITRVPKTTPKSRFQLDDDRGRGNPGAFTKRVNRY
jgi:hypothetical protein